MNSLLYQAIDLVKYIEKSNIFLWILTLGPIHKNYTAPYIGLIKRKALNDPRIRWTI